jgi:hypothetical protein
MCTYNNSFWLSLLNPKICSDPERYVKLKNHLVLMEKIKRTDICSCICNYWKRFKNFDLSFWTGRETLFILYLTFRFIYRLDYAKLKSYDAPKDNETFCKFVNNLSKTKSYKIVQNSFIELEKSIGKYEATTCLSH